VTFTRYDEIGRSYTRTRRTDPRVAAQILAALGDARSIVNIGAGAGSYEPDDREVVAVEPSPTMIAQRPPGSARVLRAYAEALPFRDGEFDAALAIFTVHHWTDKRRGLLELARVARRQVILSYDANVEEHFWLVEDYLPEVGALDNANRDYTSQAIARVLDVVRIDPVLVPADCIDGFAACYWNRPEAYLDPDVQAGISGIARLDPAVRDRATRQLRADLASGAWDARHGHLRALTELDVGYRLIIAGAESALPRRDRPLP
jgi:SAM-dependent methyltransferase